MPGVFVHDNTVFAPANMSDVASRNKAHNWLRAHCVSFFPAALIECSTLVRPSYLLALTAGLCVGLKHDTLALFHDLTRWLQAYGVT